jgi:hypothetical protein
MTMPAPTLFQNEIRPASTASDFISKAHSSTAERSRVRSSGREAPNPTTFSHTRYLDLERSLFAKSSTVFSSHAGSAMLSVAAAACLSQE